MKSQQLRATLAFSLRANHLVSIETDKGRNVLLLPEAKIPDLCYFIYRANVSKQESRK